MEAIIPSETIKESKVLRLPQPRNEDLEHRGKLAAAYDYVPTDWEKDPVEIPVLIGAESLLRGLKKDDLSRRKKGDPRRALVTHQHVTCTACWPCTQEFCIFKGEDVTVQIRG